MLTKVFDLLRSEVDVVAAVGDGRAVIEAAAALDPDLIILDISMPIMNGLDAARKLAGRNTKAKLIFLTIYEPKEALEAALAAGAAGYVVKSRMHTDLIPMIRKVLE
jgi:DNA-binding NarL/FixJ family response regulator